MLAYKKIEKDLETLQNDLKALINDAKEISLTKLEQEEETLHKLREQVKVAGKKVETAVEHHPYAAVGAALGLGFFLGKFLPSPDRSP
jgi:ElaB/YqjD/DUF883 family membrane-anchored ribosome-binding protein